MDRARAEPRIGAVDERRQRVHGLQRARRRGAIDERQFAEVGVEVVYFPYTMSTSSTVLRRALAALSGGGERVNG